MYIFIAGLTSRKIIYVQVIVNLISQRDHVTFMNMQKLE